MTVFPAAKAAQMPPVGIAYGKFQGGTTTTTPTGEDSFSRFSEIAERA